MNKPDLATLGRHLQSLRQTRGISLSQLALDAGIAKSNLSRIEQGCGNPTLDTIWRLAVQLEVPFGTLVAPMNESLGDGGIQVRLIDQGTDHPKVDAYWMSCAPHTERLAEPHAAGTRESIVIISGQLEVGTLEDTKPLSAGETHTFPADQAHIYRAGDAWVTLLVTVVYEQDELAP